MPTNLRSLVACAAIFLAQALGTAGAQTDLPEGVGCVPVNRLLQPERDYRLRNSDRDYAWNFADNWRIHTSVALERMRAGEYSRRVLADLNFTLRIWPNHLDALRGLIEYDLAGGQPYDFQRTECYFVEAKRMFPDDAGVLVAEGSYFARKGARDRALVSYQKALELAPQSAEAHYNIGLLYFDEGNLDKAAEHARIAYAGGYPMPGLMKKLQQRGVKL